MCYLQNWWIFASYKPIAWTIASIPVAAVTLRIQIICKNLQNLVAILLWWNGCGKVTIEHCIICVQLKVKKNRLRFWWGKNNIFTFACYTNLWRYNSFLFWLTSGDDRYIGHLKSYNFAIRSHSIGKTFLLKDKLKYEWKLIWYLNNHLTSCTSSGWNLEICFTMGEYELNCIFWSCCYYYLVTIVSVSKQKPMVWSE